MTIKIRLPLAIASLWVCQGLAAAETAPPLALGWTPSPTVVVAMAQDGGACLGTGEISMPGLPEGVTRVLVTVELDQNCLQSDTQLEWTTAEGVLRYAQRDAITGLVTDLGTLAPRSSAGQVMNAVGEAPAATTYWFSCGDSRLQEHARDTRVFAELHMWSSYGEGNMNVISNGYKCMPSKSPSWSRVWGRATADGNFDIESVTNRPAVNGYTNGESSYTTAWFKRVAGWGGRTSGTALADMDFPDASWCSWNGGFAGIKYTCEFGLGNR